MFRVPIGCALGQTAGDLVERRWLLAHVVKIHAKFWIRLRKMTLETKRVHVSDFYSWLPLIESNFGALDSFTLTMIVKCVRLGSYFDIVS